MVTILSETEKKTQIPDWDYEEKDLDIIQKLGADYDPNCNLWVYQGKTLMLAKMAKELIDHLHKLTHLSAKKKMKALLERDEMGKYFPNRDSLLQQVVNSCRACAQVNPGKAKIGQEVRLRGYRPGNHWEINFAEIKPGMYGYKYFLVFVDTFSGWVEAFPNKHETAKMVTKKLMEEIFPRYGMPQVLGSDNGVAFVS